VSQEFVTRDLLMEFRLQQFIDVVSEGLFNEPTGLATLTADESLCFDSRLAVRFGETIDNWQAVDFAALDPDVVLPPSIRAHRSLTPSNPQPEGYVVF
jgi:hypothetical protein